MRLKILTYLLSAIFPLTPVFGQEKSKLPIEEKIKYYSNLQKDLESVLIRHTRTYATKIMSTPSFVLYSMEGFMKDSSQVVVDYYDFPPIGKRDKHDQLSIMTGDLTITDAYLDGKFYSSKNELEIENKTYDFPLSLSNEKMLDLQKKIFFFSSDLVSLTSWSLKLKE